MNMDIYRNRDMDTEGDRITDTNRDRNTSRNGHQDRYMAGTGLANDLGY
jgi:hypothetical protein